MLLTQTYTQQFTDALNFRSGVLSVFNYQFGRKSGPDYDSDFKSIIYTAETLWIGGKLYITVNVGESLVGKNYKVIYLLYDDMVSQTTDQLAGEIEIDTGSGLLISKNKNFILIDITSKSELILKGSEYIRHLQSDNVNKVNLISSTGGNQFLDIKSYGEAIIDGISTNAIGLNDSTIASYGIKIS